MSLLLYTAIVSMRVYCTVYLVNGQSWRDGERNESRQNFGCQQIVCQAELPVTQQMLVYR